MILLAVATVLLVIDVVVTQLPASPRAPAVQSGAIAPSQLAVGTAVDEKAPDVTLRDDGGRPTPLASFRGRYLVLAPAMTLCHEVCPMTTAALGQLQAAVRREGLARDVAVAEVSVDPWRDTPARLRAYRRLTGTGIDLLTGAPDQLRRLWRFLGVYYKRVPQGHPPDVDWLTGRPERFDVQHSDGLFIVDPAGHWRMGTVGMPSVGGRIAPPLRRLLNDQGRSNLRRPRAPWTPEQALADLRPQAARRRRRRGAAPSAHASARAQRCPIRRPPRRRGERPVGTAAVVAGTAGRPQRMGVVVLPLPRRVPALRAGVGALRQARRVPGRRRQRRRRRRARLPAQPSRELPELRRFGGRERVGVRDDGGPADHGLPRGRRPPASHPHGPVPAPQALDADIERNALGT